MKKQTKRMAALGLAAAMTATLLAGCGGTSASSATASGSTPDAAADSAATAATAGSYTDYSAGFPERIKLQIPIYDRSFEGWDPTDNYYTRWAQKEFGDKYNIDLEYVSIGRSTEVQDYMQMIAAHTEPNIVFHYDMPQAVNYYAQGAMQDIDYDEVAYYAPDYWEKMQSTIEKYGKLDGHNAFILAERDPIYYSYVRLIRKDWCDKVGMEVPKTQEELEAVAKAWKEAGLGTVSEGLLTKSFNYEYGWIDPDASADELALYLDLNVAPFTWDASERYLKNRNQMYNEGILDPEFYLNTEDSLTKGKFVSGQSGVYGLYISSGTDVISSLKANDPNAEVAVIPTTVSEGFKPYYYQYPPYGMIMGISVDSTDEQRAAVYMYLNWMMQPDNLFFLQNGIEGETYNLDENGIAIPVKDYEGEAKLSQNSNKDMWILVHEAPATYGDEEKDLIANKLTLAPEGYESLIDASYELCKSEEQYGIISPIFTKSVESLTEYSADLNALWQEAYVDCITCAPEEFDAKYAEYSQEYLDAGYQAILDEKQALIDEGAVLIVE